MRRGRRLRPYSFHWRPERHVQWHKVLESEPVSGTSDWTRVQTPVLKIGERQKDHLLWIEVVLDGEGEGWLADVGVSLQGVEGHVPVGPVVRA